MHPVSFLIAALAVTPFTSATGQQPLPGGRCPVGLALSIVSAPFIGSLVYGVGDHDPRSPIVAAFLAAAMGLLGTSLPVRRAANTDPMLTLRAE